MTGFVPVASPGFLSRRRCVVMHSRPVNEGEVWSAGTNDQGGGKSRDGYRKEGPKGKSSSGGGPSVRQRRLKSQRSRRVTTDEVGRVGSYCTCEEFDLEDVVDFLKREPSAEVLTFDDSVHFRSQERPEESVFVFPYGSVVIWGMDVGSEQVMLRDLKKFQLSPLREAEGDEFRYEYDSTPGITNEAVKLTVGVNSQETILERLALSHALAQSVKLATFERSVQETIMETRYLPKELAVNGKISASRRDVQKNVGRLFLDRHNVYLYADLLDTPDYFWDYETHEWLYSTAAKYLDVRQRAEFLFKRLDMVRELYDLLSQELQFKHSSDLEMVIIGLITIEILISLAKDWVEAIATLTLGTKAGLLIGVLFLTFGIATLFVVLVSRRRREDHRVRMQNSLQSAQYTL